MCKREAGTTENLQFITGRKFQCALPECGMMVVVCGRCDLRQRYCCKEHAQVARIEQLRIYRASPRGREASKRSSRALRKRIAEAKRGGPEAEATAKEKRAKRVAERKTIPRYAAGAHSRKANLLTHCCVCGREVVALT